MTAADALAYFRAALAKAREASRNPEWNLPG
jgi:hypothetical protein